MDVTNPGLVNVADQVIGNPSVAVSSLAIPEDSDVLVPVANQGMPRARDVAAAGDTTGPTPTSSDVIQQQPASPSQSRGEIPGVAPQFLPFPQNNLTNTVDQQSIPQSQTAEFSVAAGTVIQTNQNAATQRDYTVTKVLDADTGLPPVIPTAAPTTRLKLFVAPTDLLSFGISLLGRILTFDSSILTVADRKATRPITYFGQDYVIIDVNEPDDPSMPVLAIPQPGDTFFIYVQRQNSEVFSDTNAASQNVDVFPPAGGVPAQPPTPNPFTPQNQLSMGTVDVSVGPQPNQQAGVPAIITGGVQVPTAINVNVADQATSVGLPKNIYV